MEQKLETMELVEGGDRGQLLTRASFIFFIWMSKPKIQSGNSQGAVKLIKVPLEIKESLKRYSTIYQQREADDNNNLISRRVSNSRCLICEQFFVENELEVFAACRHSFCMECLHNYMLYKITVSEEIECPQSDCQEIISREENCYEQIPQRYKNRYQNFKLFRQTHSNSKQMLCQAPNCQGTIETTELKCGTCKFQICQKCHLMQHFGSCDSSYLHNFLQWRICPDCQEFSEIEANKSDNKIKCKCGYKYCSVCRERWSQAHLVCNEHVDTSLEDQVFCRASVLKSSRCSNFIRSILLILSIPFIVIFILLASILTLVAVIMLAIPLSPCLSFMQLDSYLQAIVCFPCVGIYKIGQYIKRYVGTVCSIGCDFLGRLGLTIKALCCYNKNEFITQQNKFQYVS